MGRWVEVKDEPTWQWREVNKGRLVASILLIILVAGAVVSAIVIAVRG